MKNQLKLIIICMLSSFSFFYLQANETNYEGINSNFLKLSEKGQLFNIYPNPVQGISNLTFVVQNDGKTQISAYSVDGKKIISIERNLQKGINTFQITFPKGVFLIQVNGNGFSYTNKLISQTSGNIKAEIQFESYEAFEELNVQSNSMSKVQMLVDLPTLTTSSVTSITSTDAICGGNITNTGGASVTDRGVCWNDLPNPTISNSKTNDGSGIGSFSSTIASLTLGTTYYVRAYATNSGGTAYGNEIIFKALSIGDEYAGGKVFYLTNNCLQGLVCTVNTQRQFKWDDEVIFGYKATGATGFDIGTGYSNTINIINTLGAGDYSAYYCDTLNTKGYSDWFLPSIGELSEIYLTLIPRSLIPIFNYWSSTERSGYTDYAFKEDFSTFPSYTTSFQEKNNQYYVCAVRSFPCAAKLTTTSISSISNTAAISGGYISNDGAATITSRGVCWSTTPNPTIANNITNNGTGIGSYTSSLSGLTPNTTYYVRAYATNTTGTAYGNQVSFTTLQLAVGQSYQSGKIAYILQSGDPGYIAGQVHGLIASPISISTNTNAPWSNYLATIGTSTELGTGNANTNAIVANQGSGSYAAKLCYDLVYGGYSDWYLPSKDELNKLYVNRALLDIEINYTYWSSSEISSAYAYTLLFSTGAQNPYVKYASYRVRAVRSF